MKTILALTLFCLPLPGAEGWFGMMGLAPVDTARISAFCSDEAPADPCQLELHFHNGRGQIIKQSALLLQPGDAGLLDIRASEAGGVEGRVTIIPCILVGRGQVISDVRIFDVFTLRQRVLANGVERSGRAGEVHFGVSGITASDTARINAVCAQDASDGCEVTLKFHLSGNRVVKQTTVSLAPGAGAFLDLRASEAGLGVRQGEIIPCFLVGRGAVFGTYETIDSASGLTTLLAYPAASIVP